MKHYFLPVIKFSYYTGNVSYATASSAYSLFERCKELLDTNGNGWKDPITDFSRLHFKIDPIDLSNFLEDEGMKSCVSLVLNKDDADNEEDMLVELPKIELEENEELSTIWIPFK